MIFGSNPVYNAIFDNEKYIVVVEDKTTYSDAADILEKEGFAEGIVLNYRGSDIFEQLYKDGRLSFTDEWTAFSIFGANRLVVAMKSTTDHVMLRMLL